MFGSRALWVSLGALVALSSAVASCAKKAEPIAATAQCYWLSDQGAGWVARPDLANANACFEMDSCAGGLGVSRGGCYKWSADASAPARPWTDFGLAPPTQATSEAATEMGPKGSRFVQRDGFWQSADERREAKCFERDACAGGLGTEKGVCFKWAISAEAPALPWSETLTKPTLAADVPPPDDLYYGSYEETSDCHEKGCSYRTVRYGSATPLYAKTDRRAPIVATLPPSECVLQTGADSLQSTPERGVVLETYPPFDAGDVVYFTNSEGEGYFTVWRRGQYHVIEPDGVVIRWDDTPKDPREGFWV
jgi:hypothetical protein